MKKLLIVDGNSIINRAFYAIKNLTAKDGLNTGGIYGFINILTRKVEEENPDYIVVAFDVHAPTFRHKEYNLYKAQRKGMPEELAEQMPVAKELLTAMNIAYIEAEGYEADDLIGTVSAKCKQNDVICQILTGDKDDLQLAGDKTEVHLITTSKGRTETKVYKDKDVFERYNLTPLQFIDLKGLMGDSSDNIPGVAGVGEKTAISLLTKYGSLENVYLHLDDGEIKGALLTKLKNDKENAFLSKHLATIKQDVPIKFELSDFETKPYNYDLFIPMLQRLDFNSMLKKYSEQAVFSLPETERKEGTDEMIAEISEYKQIFYILFEDKIEIFNKEYIAVFSEINKLKNILENEDVKKIGCNIKSDIVYFANMDIDFKGEYFDCAIAAYILDPARSAYTIDEIATEYLGIETEKTVAALPKLYEHLLIKIKENEQEELFFNIEMPLVRVLAEMQIYGFKVDKQKLIDFSKKLSEDIDGLQKMIYMQAGEEFNILSPKQLGVVLFEHMKLPPVKKTKTGYSTGVDVLNKIRKYHSIIDYILDYRHLTKLKSTYTDGLASVINDKTGKIHSCFNQTVTATGRISSTEPNLQNIPVKMELGREIRKVFVPSDDEHVLVDADYSQIELRVLAHMAQDEKMSEAFKNDLDIHTQTASEVFGVSKNMVTPEMRSNAKAVNFGIVYGISEFSLAENIGTTRKNAKEYIDNYLSTYSGIDSFMKECVKSAKQNGYVKTLLNRRRYIPEIMSSNYNLRSFGERVAMNAPIQGTAADIIKIAMVNVYMKLKKHAVNSHLILQVHDELIVEAHKDEIETVKEIIKNEMENAFLMSVPLKADIGIGENWYEAK